MQRVVAIAIAFWAWTLPVAAGAATFTNPIVEASVGTGTADPSVVLYRGYYYYCRALGDRAIGVARSRRLQDIGAAPMVIVFTPAAGSDHVRQLWAPELQRIHGRWYIYFTASDGINANHRMYALQAVGDDPQGGYVLKGRVKDESDRWAIDGVALEIRGNLYFVWSGWPEAKGDFPQVLYIAAMRDPWTIVGSRHLIAAPEHPWERAVAPVLEGPEPLVHRGSLHLVYSAGASWSDDYALGLLSYRGGDPLIASSWRKHALPVFAKSPEAQAFGVGHPSFVRSPDGREDWIVYHATDRPAAGWRARSVRAQPFGWSRDGTPVFGRPVAIGHPIEAPSGTPGAPHEAARPPSRTRSPTDVSRAALGTRAAGCSPACPLAVRTSGLRAALRP